MADRTAVGWAVASLLLAAPAVYVADLPLQQWVLGLDPPGVVNDYFTATEAFGNGFGVAMIVLVVVVIDRTRRVQTGRLLAASLGAGVVADAVKLFVARARPQAAGLEDLATSSATAADTFSGWLPLASNGAIGQSFPSAHTATAFGLAVVLAALCPRGSRLFYAFAAGVALQRVCVGAHYLSDALVGVAIGVSWGVACCHAGGLARWFDRLEAWWSDRFGWPLPDGHPAQIDSEQSLLQLPTRVADLPAAATRQAA